MFTYPRAISAALCSLGLLCSSFAGAAGIGIYNATALVDNPSLADPSLVISNTERFYGWRNRG
jgi:hypothetical protein